MLGIQYGLNVEFVWFRCVFQAHKGGINTGRGGVKKLGTLGTRKSYIYFFLIKQMVKRLMAMISLGTLLGTKWEQVGTSECLHVPSLLPQWEQMKSLCIPCVARAVANWSKSLFPAVPSNVPSRGVGVVPVSIGVRGKRALLFPLYPVFFAPPPPPRK